MKSLKATISRKKSFERDEARSHSLKVGEPRLPSNTDDRKFPLKTSKSTGNVTYNVQNITPNNNNKNEQRPYRSKSVSMKHGVRKTSGEHRRGSITPDKTQLKESNTSLPDNSETISKSPSQQSLNSTQSRGPLPSPGSVKRTSVTESKKPVKTDEGMYEALTKKYQNLNRSKATEQAILIKLEDLLKASTLNKKTIKDIHSQQEICRKKIVGLDSQIAECKSVLDSLSGSREKGQLQAEIEKLQSQLAESRKAVSEAQFGMMRAERETMKYQGDLEMSKNNQFDSDEGRAALSRQLITTSALMMKMKGEAAIQDELLLSMETKVQSATLNEEEHLRELKFLRAERERLLNNDNNNSNNSLNNSDKSLEQNLISSVSTSILNVNNERQKELELELENYKVALNEANEQAIYLQNKCLELEAQTATALSSQDENFEEELYLVQSAASSAAQCMSHYKNELSLRDQELADAKALIEELKANNNNNLGPAGNVNQDNDLQALSRKATTKARPPAPKAMMELQQELQLKKAELVTKEKDIVALSQDYNLRSNAKNDEIRNMKEILNLRTLEMETSRAQLAENKEATESLQLQVSQLQGQCQSLEKEKKKLLELQQQQQDPLSMILSETESEKQQEKLESKVAEIQVLKRELKDAKSSIGNLESERERLLGEVKRQQKENEHVNEALMHTIQQKLALASQMEEFETSSFPQQKTAVQTC